LLEAQDRLAGGRKKAILLQARVELHSTHATRQAVSKNVASEDLTSLKIGSFKIGAQDFERSIFLAPR
jgi:hypothetical protein